MASAEVASARSIRDILLRKIDSSVMRVGENMKLIGRPKVFVFVTLLVCVPQFTLGTTILTVFTPALVTIGVDGPGHLLYRWKRHAREILQSPR